MVLVDSSNILNIPDHRYIKGWEEIPTDGTTYHIEYSDSQNYFYKSYASPSFFDSLKEAQAIINFTERIFDVLSFYKIYPYYDTIKPFLCIWHGFVVTNYGVTKKESKRSEKLRKHQIRRFKKGKPIEDGYIIYKE